MIGNPSITPGSRKFGKQFVFPDTETLLCDSIAGWLQS